MKTTVEKIIQVAFTSNEYSDGFPSHVKLEFNPGDMQRIAKTMQLVKEHNLFSANIDFYGTPLSEMEEGELYEEVKDFRIGVSYLTCYNERFYFYGQSKYDATSNFESEAMDFFEIWNLFAEPATEPETPKVKINVWARVGCSFTIECNQYAIDDATIVKLTQQQIAKLVPCANGEAYIPEGCATVESTCEVLNTMDYILNE